eukprot:CAMPEP_0185707546 /NCGR_PEP_ID=MMETSP1164-20130828/24520_1 /TAXON_ID=1104430 /ORGANISM="Chrysoreinhardia sp, Strain CCMP2950" /LENGTH=131 /DNA_ID=CAMNT_0028374975 /DNA_START=33 /DNA_END=424 /DNA_ORIENTATION=-
MGTDQSSIPHRALRALSVATPPEGCCAGVLNATCVLVSQLACRGGECIGDVIHVNAPQHVVSWCCARWAALTNRTGVDDNDDCGVNSGGGALRAMLVVVATIGLMALGLLVATVLQRRARLAKGGPGALAV